MNLVFVVGMARSGTSAVSGLLKSMGCSSIDSKPAEIVGHWNPDYHENVIINALAEAIHPWYRIEPKKPSSVWVDAIVAYILEKPEPYSALVLKSPAFPFIISQLREIAKQCDTTPYFVVTRRDKEAVCQSCHRFTGQRIQMQHWYDLYDVAYRKIDDELGVNACHIDYEYLIDNWETCAKTLAGFIPGLTVPSDGGIRAELNHKGLTDEAIR